MYLLAVVTDVPLIEAPAVVLSDPMWRSWMIIGATAAVAIVIGLLVHAVVFSVVKRLPIHRTETAVSSLTRRMSAPARLGFPLIALQFVISQSVLDPPVLERLERVASVALIATFTWAAIRAVGVAQDLLLARRRIDVADNLVARRMHTQVKVLGHTAAVILGIIGVAVALMTFPNVRQVGTSLLASAGIAGLIAGVAARPVLESLIAGVQIALTEPISIDDVVVVEREWGRIEEITATYIVVKVWDERRLVIPLSYFITRPIENWTRRTANILGTVMLHVDYTVPVADVRNELKRILDASTRWDRRGWALQVTDATPQSLQLRALMSAPDGPTAFELRCEVREKLIDFLQRKHAGALPRIRATVEEAESGLAAAG